MQILLILLGFLTISTEVWSMRRLHQPIAIFYPSQILEGLHCVELFKPQEKGTSQHKSTTRHSLLPPKLHQTLPSSFNSSLNAPQFNPLTAQWNCQLGKRVNEFKLANNSNEKTLQNQQAFLSRKILNLGQQKTKKAKDKKKKRKNDEQSKIKRHLLIPATNLPAKTDHIKNVSQEEN